MTDKEKQRLKHSLAAVAAWVLALVFFFPIFWMGVYIN